MLWAPVMRSLPLWYSTPVMFRCKFFARTAALNLYQTYVCHKPIYVRIRSKHCWLSSSLPAGGQVSFVRLFFPLSEDSLCGCRLSIFTLCDFAELLNINFLISVPLALIEQQKTLLRSSDIILWCFLSCLRCLDFSPRLDWSCRLQRRQSWGAFPVSWRAGGDFRWASIGRSLSSPSLLFSLSPLSIFFRLSLSSFSLCRLITAFPGLPSEVFPWWELCGVACCYGSQKSVCARTVEKFLLACEQWFV